MKTTLLTLLILFCLVFSAKSQMLICFYCFDSTANCAAPSMSVPEPIITIENTPTNLWEIGTIQKNSFTSGYNSPGAIATDTVDPYPTNTTSTFLISWVTNEPSNSIHWTTVRLQFAYNVDSDTLTDYGSIEFSPDSGATWIDLLNVNDQTYGSYLEWDLSGPNGIIPPTLSGNSNGWIHRSLNMHFLTHDLAIPAGTAILWRFSFTSDGNQSNKDGLMFDDIVLLITPPLSVEELTADNIQISPNPVNSIMDIQITGTTEKLLYSIYSSEGKLIKQFDDEDAETALDLNTLNSGIYYLTIHNTDNQFLAAKRFIKQ
ncbi:T9SS type A sorting domain-containing protein [uncultured Fluviicola sp.]|uniref:T9SS type A sorting domain-containing protein n=1 Tax=uncultured Fluviicola sp. TaxID=463303 RepID=UPI0025CE1A20|nr:T9SS type A sorting domain-containing protein [uncultured Fluviicola sp.]